VECIGILWAQVDGVGLSINGEFDGDGLAVLDHLTRQIVFDNGNVRARHVSLSKCTNSYDSRGQAVRESSGRDAALASFDSAFPSGTARRYRDATRAEAIEDLVVIIAIAGTATSVRVSPSPAWPNVGDMPTDDQRQ
jgi:hypothetical protein